MGKVYDTKVLFPFSARFKGQSFISAYLSMVSGTNSCFPSLRRIFLTKSCSALMKLYDQIIFQFALAWLISESNLLSSFFKHGLWYKVLFDFFKQSFYQNIMF